MSDLLDTLFPADRPVRIQTPGRGENGFGMHPENIEGVGKRILDQIPTRWRTILTLEIQGIDKTQIAEMMQLTLGAISQITRDQRYIDFRNEYLAELDGDFLSMKPLAFAALKGGLQSSDENTALRASEQWFKGASFGGYSKTPEPSTTVTAEDVARQLLNITADNVQVNIHTHVGGDEDAPK